MWIFSVPPYSSQLHLILATVLLTFTCQTDTSYNGRLRILKNSENGWIKSVMVPSESAPQELSNEWSCHRAFIRSRRNSTPHRWRLKNLFFFCLNCTYPINKMIKLIKKAIELLDSVTSVPYSWKGSYVSIILNILGNFCVLPLATGVTISP
jgi:hypothetical protein